MKCKEYSELLSTYVDDMLSPQEMEAVNAHLKDCEKCQKEVNALRQMKRLCHKADEVILPKDFHENLMKKIKQDASQKKIKKMSFKWQYSGAIAAAVLVGFIGMGHVFNGIGTDQSNSMTQMDKGQLESAKATYRMAAAPEEGQSGAIKESSDEVKDQQAEEESVSESPLKWQISVEDQTSFKSEFFNYLKDQAIDYDEAESTINIYKVSQSDKVKKWLEAHSMTFSGEASDETVDICVDIQ